MPGVVEKILTGKKVTAEQIADDLAWPSQSRIRSVRFPGCLLLTLGEEPALAIADKGLDPLAFAYHSGYEWVLDARPTSRRLANTRWRKGGEVYGLPLKHDSGDVIKALTPEGLERDAPSRVAEKRLPPDDRGQSIESALIRKLGDLRRMAFRFSTGDAGEVDQNLHLMITQFFVLRAIEDLGLGKAKGLPPLRKAVNGKLNRNLLHDIYAIAKEKVQEKLFDKEPFRDLAELAVAETIRTLYRQSDFPNAPSLKFDWIDPDVFGRVYERYLSTILAEAPASLQGVLFEPPVREVEEVSHRKQGGVYYTPQPLVRILVQKAIDLACPDGVTFDSLPRVADFSCGSGAFLAGALDKILRPFKDPAERSLVAKKVISERLIVGVDIDPRAVSLARLSLYLRLAQEKEPLPLPDVDRCVVVGDSLARELPGELESLEYAAVVGNPPFLATSAIQDRSLLASKFETAVGRYDFSSLFVELGLKKVKPGGSVSLVVPNRLFANTSAQAMRDYIIGKSSLETLVDFGSAPVFNNVSAYIGLLVCQKHGHQITRSDYKYVRVRQLPALFQLEPLVRAVFMGDAQSTDDLDVSLETQPTKGSNWAPIPTRLKKLFTSIEESGIQLSEVAEVKQGIKTGANDVYVLRIVDQANGSLVTVEDVFGRRHDLERAMLRPAALGPDVQRYRLYGRPGIGDQVIVYPYESGGVIPQTRMEAEFPATYAYLGSYKSELESRVSVTKSGQPWYGLIRPRDQEWLASPKILSRDLISTPSFSVDVEGGIHLIGGTAIIPADPDRLFNLLGVMNSKTFEVLIRRTASEYKGQYIKAEPGRLLSVFIPEAALDDVDLHDLVKRRLFAGEGDIAELDGAIDSVVGDYVEGQ